MKILAVISLLIFIASMMASKFTIDDSVSGQKLLLNTKDSLTQANAETKYIQAITEKKLFSKKDVESLIDASKNMANNVDLAVGGIVDINGKILTTAEIADLQESASNAYKQALNLKDQESLIEDIQVSTNVINTVGNEMILVTRAVTKELAKGRASPGQIYYSSNQTYIMQMILDSANKISEQSSYSIKDAEKLVAYTKKIKTTYGIMLSGDEKGSGRVQNRGAYKILMMNKSKLNNLIKSITSLLGAYPKIEGLRSINSEIWKNASKVQSLTNTGRDTISKTIDRKIKSYSIIDIISIISLLVTIVAGVAFYKTKLKEEGEYGKHESQAYAELKRELGPIENGDLRNPLSMNHAHTSASARNINKIIAGFRRLIIGVKEISSTLQEALGPINVISKNQKVIQENIMNTVESSKETGQELGQMNSHIMSIGNEYEQTTANYNKLNHQLHKEIESLGDIHIKMIHLSKSISGINDNINHGIGGIAHNSNDMAPRLTEVSNLMINLSLELQSMPDTEVKKKAESIIDEVCQKIEAAENSNNDASQQLNTIKQQSKALAEEFEIYRDVIQSASSGNTEITNITEEQKAMSDKMANLSKDLLDKIHNMHNIATTALGIVSDVQVSATSASDASQQLASVINNTTESIEKLNSITTRYKI